MSARHWLGAALLLAAGSAEAGLVFTPHLSEYSRLPAAQYSEVTMVLTEIEEIYNREGEKVHTGAPFIGAGESVDAALLLYKSLWAGNVFRDTRVPYFNTHPQFCRIIGTLGWQQATGAAVLRGYTAGQRSGGSGLGDLFGLCGFWTDEYLWGPVKANGLWATTVKFPVGRFDSEALLNVGTNYWSYIPQFAFHAEVFGRVYIDGTFAYQIKGDNDSPAFGGLTPTQPADMRNAEVNFAWKFSEHWFADVGYSYRETVKPNRYEKYSLNLKDQPVPANDACNRTNANLDASDPLGVFGPTTLTPEMCASASAFFIEPRSGPYEDRGIQGTLITAGLYYIYRTSTVVQLRVAQPVKGRGGQIDVVYDVHAGIPDGAGGFTRGPAVTTTTSLQNAVQEAASVSASPFLELRMVYLFWAP